MITPSFQKQLPHGVADLFFKDAARLRAIERTLGDTFARWGYSEIIPPTFEYYEALAEEAGPQLREEMYRFFDRDGRTLALRGDFTIPTARIVGTKLFDRAMPLRFFYTGSVFRYEEPKAGVRREFTQAGIELIGAATAEADAEAIALAMTALRALGLNDFRFTVGNAAYLQSTLEGVALQGTDDADLRDAIRRKNTPALNDLLGRLKIEPRQKRSLEQIPMLWGDLEILDAADCLNEESEAAVAHLRQVITILDGYGLRDYITLDLAENRGMAYYTGILFEGFVQGLGFSVASGGRYDNLISHFGPRIPAVGFAIGVERVMVALRARGGLSASVAPDIIAAAGVDFESVQAARDRGETVEVDILDRTDAELREYARVRGARELWLRSERMDLAT